jgi:hypothetical protein
MKQKDSGKARIHFARQGKARSIIYYKFISL